MILKQQNPSTKTSIRAEVISRQTKKNFWPDLAHSPTSVSPDFILEPGIDSFEVELIKSVVDNETEIEHPPIPVSLDSAQVPEYYQIKATNSNHNSDNNTPEPHPNEKKVTGLLIAGYYTIETIKVFIPAQFHDEVLIKRGKSKDVSKPFVKGILNHLPHSIYDMSHLDLTY